VGVFYKNNERIDYFILEERLAHEMPQAAKAMHFEPQSEDSQEPAMTETRGQSETGMPPVPFEPQSEDSQEPAMTETRGQSETGMPPVRKRRSFLKKIDLWFKSFVKLYRLPDQKQEAEGRYWDHASKLQALHQRVNDVALVEARLDLISQKFAELEFVFDSGANALEARLGNLEPLIERVIAQVSELRGEIQKKVDAQVSELRGESQKKVDAQVGELRGEIQKKVDAQVSELRGEIQKKVDAQVGELRREIMFQQRRLTQLALPAPAVEQFATMTQVTNERLDSIYVAFEDVFRGSRDDIKGRLVRYVDILRNAGAGHLGKPILDVGCGRGEWLELLKENNVPAYGVDLNSVMVERAAALGLDARRADALEHMKGLADCAVSAVTAFHVAEHLPFAVLIDFFDEVLRVLVPGGIAIFETPNPETMRVGATTFYNDPMHRNPIPPQVFQFMVSHRGFQDVEIIRLHPFTDGLLTQPTTDAEMLDDILFGSQDYAVIARRL